LRPSRGQRLSKVSATRKSVGVLSVAAAVSGASGNSHTSCTAHACNRAELAGHTVHGALGRDPGAVCTFPCKVVDIVRVLSLSVGGVHQPGVREEGVCRGEMCVRLVRGGDKCASDLYGAGINVRPICTGRG